MLIALATLINHHIATKRLCISSHSLPTTMTIFSFLIFRMPEQKLKLRNTINKKKNSISNFLEDLI
jgi:hypothetical protein